MCFFSYLNNPYSLKDSFIGMNATTNRHLGAIVRKE